MDKGGLYALWNAKTPKEKAKKLRTKPPVWKYPRNSEAYYRKYLYSIYEDLQKELDKYLSSYRFQNLANSFRGDDDDVEILKAVLMNMNGVINPVEVEDRLKDIYGSINDFNREEWATFQRWAVGVPFFSSEAWIIPTSKLWINQNMGLIKSLVSDIVKKVEHTFTTSFHNGERVETIAKKLSDKGGVIEGMKYRANLIARDQTTKANAQMTKRRQADAGLNHYIWRTSQDERVRPTHQRNEGRVFSYEKPPEETGNPAEDIQCRCHAEAVLAWDLPDDFSDEINGELYTETKGKIEAKNSEVFNKLYGGATSTATIPSPTPKPKRRKKTTTPTKKPTTPKTTKTPSVVEKYGGIVPDGFDIATASQEEALAVIRGFSKIAKKKDKVKLRNSFILDFIANPSDDLKAMTKNLDKFDDLAFEKLMLATHKQLSFFPELRKNLRGFGSASNVNKYAKDDIIRRFKESKDFGDSVKRYMAYRLSKEEAEKAVIGALKKKYKFRGNYANPKSGAFSAGRGTQFGRGANVGYRRVDLEGVYFSDAMAKGEEAIKSGEKMIDIQWQPKTINKEYAYEAVVAHEFGHEIDRFFNITDRNDYRIKVDNLVRKEGKTITELVSRYATSDRRVVYSEAFAEAYAEWNYADNPRPFAKMVGEIVEREIEQYRKYGIVDKLAEGE